MRVFVELVDLYPDFRWEAHRDGPDDVPEDLLRTYELARAAYVVERNRIAEAIGLDVRDDRD